jgi:hypothetical protein
MKLNEISANDPVLMTLRSSLDKRKRDMVEYQSLLKKYGDTRDALENELINVYDDLKIAYSERNQIFWNMDLEAGEKGDEWTDDDANRYGEELNNIDDEIKMLIIKRQKLEKVLS